MGWLVTFVLIMEAIPIDRVGLMTTYIAVYDLMESSLVITSWRRKEVDSDPRASQARAAPCLL